MDTLVLLRLGIALAAGLIVGLERGWQERGAKEGSRLAGIRTFGLLGLTGGLAEALSGDSPILLGFAFFSVALVMGLAHFVESQASRDYGITTVVAALITFLLGALAVNGQHVLAAAAAVVVAVLLQLKPALHGFLERVEPAEIGAALKLLLISVVILPVLPNQDYGPWLALNPYKLWWLVVLIAAISFAAYVAIKIAGRERGMLLMGLLGGFVSSTGVSIQLSRMAGSAKQKSAFAAGILVASATMFLRVLLVILVLNRSLASQMWWALVAMALPLFTAAFFYSRGSSDASADDLKLRNPVEFKKALEFAAVLAAILVASKAMQQWLGQAGVYIAALTAGLADVDAITISLASSPEVSPIIINAIILATMTNTVTKGVLVRSIGGSALGKKVLVPFGVAVLLGTAAIWLYR